MVQFLSGRACGAPDRRGNRPWSYPSACSGRPRHLPVATALSAPSLPAKVLLMLASLLGLGGFSLGLTYSIRVWQEEQLRENEITLAAQWDREHPYGASMTSPEVPRVADAATGRTASVVERRPFATGVHQLPYWGRRLVTLAVDFCTISLIFYVVFQVFLGDMLRAAVGVPPGGFPRDSTTRLGWDMGFTLS